MREKLSEIYENLDWEDCPFLSIDTETTGFGTQDKIVELSILLVHNGSIVDEYNQRFDPGISIPEKAIAVHGITDADVAGEPRFRDCLDDVLDFLGRGAPWVAHNLSFDARMLRLEIPDRYWPTGIPTLCTLETARRHPLTRHRASKKLGDVAEHLGIPFDPSLAHGAEYDAMVLAQIVPLLVSGPVTKNYTRQSQEWTSRSL